MRTRRATAVFIFCIAILFVFFDNAFISDGSNSMVPTLYPGDHFLYFRYAKPSRYGIFVVDDPINGKKLIKRIIGLPGEKIAVVGNSVFIDGKILREPYLKKNELSVLFLHPYYFSVPPDHFFVLGDNRDRSRDSRSFGPVHGSSVHERAIVVFWPISRWGWLW